MGKTEQRKTSRKPPKRAIAKKLKKEKAKKKTTTLHHKKIDNTTSKKIASSGRKRKDTKVKKEASNPLTSQQLQDFKDYVNIFEEISVSELKSILKKNSQVCSGAKKDLVERCAQCKLLGCLPSCPKCFAGKLRYNMKTGEYKCPGYMDDTKFVNCGFKTKDSSEVTRNPWQD